MKTKLGDKVRYEVDLSALPPLSPRQEADLATLAQQTDEKIDTEDSPEMPANASAARGRFYKPVKQQITARVDADVIDWLKAQGAGYQARMNAILRREMLAALRAKKRA